MKKENKFYLAFLSTIMALRLWVFFFPLRKIMIDGTIIHHFWIGIILLLITYTIQRKYSSIAEVLLPVSCGIIADELIYILLGGATVADYWSVYSLYGCIIVSIIFFIFREAIVEGFYKK